MGLQEVTGCDNGLSGVTRGVSGGLPRLTGVYRGLQGV